MRNSYIVMDLQFGSTGKGLLAGYLGDKWQPDTVVSAWGPNAGHTYISAAGVKYVTTMLPIGAITSPRCRAVLLGPGSVIDLQALMDETQYAVIQSGGRAPKYLLIIHPQAMVLRERHKLAETLGSNIKIGSTMKGTGAALIEKTTRSVGVSPLIRDATDDPVFTEFVFRMEKLGILVHVSEPLYNEVVDSSELMQIEGAQGYSLGVHRQFWPNVTSREVSPAQILADCALPIRRGCPVKTFGTLRTFPIRVANRYDASGSQIGYSGDCYPDQRELTWEELGQAPELTTVTKLQRRVFTFSMQQLRDAYRLCDPAGMFLNFCNYMEPGEAYKLKLMIEAETGGQVRWLGVGPSHNDVVETELYDHGP